MFHCACPQARTVGPQVCLLANLISWEGGWECRESRGERQTRLSCSVAYRKCGQRRWRSSSSSRVLPSSLPVIPSHVLSLRRCESQKERETGSVDVRLDFVNGVLALSPTTTATSSQSSVALSFVVLSACCYAPPPSPSPSPTNVTRLVVTTYVGTPGTRRCLSAVAIKQRCRQIDACGLAE